MKQEADFIQATSASIPEMNSSVVVSGNPMIAKIPLRLDVIIGFIRLTANDVINLKQGDILNIESRSDHFVQVCINGRRIAFGQLLTMDDGNGNLAIEVTQLEDVEGNEH